MHIAGQKCCYFFMYNTACVSQKMSSISVYSMYHGDSLMFFFL